MSSWQSQERRRPLGTGLRAGGAGFLPPSARPRSHRVELPGWGARLDVGALCGQLARGGRGDICAGLLSPRARCWVSVAC